MEDINPYSKPLNSIIKAENIIWEVQRIGWEVNRVRDARVAIGMKVAFIVDKKLVRFVPQMRQETIAKGTRANIIRYGTVLLLKLITDTESKDEYDNCYFLGNFKIDDILPGFLSLDS